MTDMNGDVPEIFGRIPYRMAFAGGWIDQPFVNRLNPDPPGSMVVVSIKPLCRFMNRCGMATSTRVLAEEMWGELPDRDPSELVEELYNRENDGSEAPSGAQDMVGLIYPGISRIDFDHKHEGGYFPMHVESNTDRDVVEWLERHIFMVPVCPRPEGYFPLDEKNLDPSWIGRLGRSGKDCFDAIVGMDSGALGESMNECMRCWEAILPHTVRHPSLKLDLIELLRFYQQEYDGAMYSGCGGGYIYVVSEYTVPGGFRVKVRI